MVPERSLISPSGILRDMPVKYTVHAIREVLSYLGRSTGMILPSCFSPSLNILASQHAVLDHYNIYFISTAMLLSISRMYVLSLARVKGV